MLLLLSIILAIPLSSGGRKLFSQSVSTSLLQVVNVSKQMTHNFSLSELLSLPPSLILLTSIHASKSQQLLLFAPLNVDDVPLILSLSNLRLIKTLQ